MTTAIILVAAATIALAPPTQAASGNGRAGMAEKSPATTDELP